jgi:hypothetical protein
VTLRKMTTGKSSNLIRRRCQEGIDRARARGKLFGRRPKLDAGQRRKIAERYANGETMAELARDYDMRRSHCLASPATSGVTRVPTPGLV